MGLAEVCLQFLGSAFADLLSGHFFHSVISAYPPWHPSLTCSDWRPLLSLFAARSYLLSSCSAFALSERPWRISSVLQGVASLLLALPLKVPTGTKKGNDSFRNRLVHSRVCAFLIVFCQTTDRQTYHSEKLVNLVYTGSGIIMYMAFFKVTVEEPNGEPTSLSFARRSSSKRAFSSCKMQMKGIQLTFTSEVSSYLHLRFVSKLVLTDQSALLERLDADKSQTQQGKK